MIADMQQQYCKSHHIGISANEFGMDGLESDTQFVRELCRWTDLTPSALAIKAGLAATTMLRAYNGKAVTRLSQPTIDKLRATFPDFPQFVDVDAIADGVSIKSYVAVKVMPSYAGMGGGGNGEGDRAVAMLPRQLIEDELRGHPNDFELIDVRGDSMMPDFHHGDQILIDRRDRDPRQPGPFALWDDDGYVVKLVERIPKKRGWYRVFSANDRYSPYEVEETETTIMGRPVWFARRL